MKDGLNDSIIYNTFSKCRNAPTLPSAQSGRTCISRTASVNRAALLKGICRQRSGANVLVCEDGREALLNVGSAKPLSEATHGPFQSRPNRL